MRVALFGSLLVAVVLGLGVEAHAGNDVISTGAVLKRFALSQPPQPILRCTIANVGKKPVSVDAVKLVDEGGNLLDIDVIKSNCVFPNPIFPGLTCGQTSFDGSKGLFVRCEVDVHGSGKTLRVQLESYGNPSGDIETSQGQR